MAWQEQRVRSALVVGLALLVFLVTSPAQAEQAIPAQLTRDQLSEWIDPLFAEQMARLHVPGAVFVLVKDGQIAYAQGYGMAEREQNIPVDPETTAFRAMSVSKPFTATAIMQLVEQGKIRLDQDVNSYLTRVRIPPTFPQPVTIENLLTHTAGFDYDVEAIGTIDRHPDEVQPLAEFLRDHPPVRIHAPGELRLYSNAAYDVLGLVVEEVSGQPFPDYVAEHILRPLGMERSSFDAQPPAGQMAVSYRWQDDAFQPLDPHYFSNTPSAGLTTTATDMARFILAQLQGGSLDGQRILDESTVEMMHQRHFDYHPDAYGTAYGFNTVQIENYQVLWHDGWELHRFRTKLALYPDRNMGFFVAINSAGDDSGLIDDLSEQIDRRLAGLPAPPGVPQPPAGFAERAGRYSGVFRRTDYSHHTIGKAVLLRGERSRWVHIESPGDGTLTLRFGSDGRPFTLVEESPSVFRTEGFQTPVVFIGDDDTRPGYLAWGTSTYQRVPWYETGEVQQRLGLSFAVMFLLAALGFPIAMLARRRNSPPGGLSERLAGLTAWLVATLNLIFLVAFVLTLSRAYEIGLEYGLPPLLIGLLLLPLLTTALSIGLLLWTVVLWVRRSWTIGNRVVFSAFTLVAIAFIPFLNYWNLLGLPD